MPFVPILTGLLVLAVVLLGLVAARLRGSLQRFGRVRGALRDHLTDRSGMLRARTAAVGVAVSDFRQDLFGRSLPAGAPRSIGNSSEREDHRVY